MKVTEYEEYKDYETYTGKERKKVTEYEEYTDYEIRKKTVEKTIKVPKVDIEYEEHTVKVPKIIIELEDYEDIEWVTVDEEKEVTRYKTITKKVPAYGKGYGHKH